MQIRHYFPFRYLKFPREFLKLPRAIRISFVLFLIYYLGWGIVTAYEPIYIKNVVGSYSNVGFTFAIFNILALFFSLTLGALLDRVNKKNVIRFFLLFYIPFSYLFLKIRTLSQFLAFRAYHGIIATGLWISGESYVRQHSPKGKAVESITLFDLASILALIIGGILGAYLIYKIGFNIFYAVSFFAFLSLLFSNLLPDHEKSNFKIKIFRGIRKELKDLKENKDLKRFLFFLFFFVIASGSMGMIFPLFLKYIGAELWQIGLIYSISMSPFLFEGFFALFKKRTRLLKVSLFFASLMFLSMFFIRNILIIFIASLAISICFSAIGPILSGRLTETMSPRKRGELTGLIGAMRHIGLIITSLSSGFIADALGLNFVFLLNFILLFFLLLIVKKVFKK